MAEIENPHLLAIARALNVEPETLISGALEGELGEAAALLKLWSRIAGSQGRRRVLSLMQQEAERSDHRE